MNCFEAELAQIGLSQKLDPKYMIETPMIGPRAIVLNDGDY